MINKNKFSIKNTKKVLHKVGKQWVVVSAVLLGLVAGGAAVNETANADTTANASQQEVSQAPSSNASNVAKPASKAVLGATAAPASTARLGGVRGKVANAKTDIKSFYNNGLVTDAENEVNNYVKPSSNASTHAAAATAYNDLINNASANSIESYVNNGAALGTTSDTVANGTWLGEFNQAVSDANAIYSNNPTNPRVTKYLTKLNGLYGTDISKYSKNISAKDVLLALKVPNNNGSVPLNYSYPETSAGSNALLSLAYSQFTSAINSKEASVSELNNSVSLPATVSGPLNTYVNEINRRLSSVRNPAVKQLVSGLHLDNIPTTSFRDNNGNIYKGKDLVSIDPTVTGDLNVSGNFNVSVQKGTTLGQIIDSKNIPLSISGGQFTGTNIEASLNPTTNYSAIANIKKQITGPLTKFTHDIQVKETSIKPNLITFAKMTDPQMSQTQAEKAANHKLTPLTNLQNQIKSEIKAISKMDLTSAISKTLDSINLTQDIKGELAAHHTIAQVPHNMPLPSQYISHLTANKIAGLLDGNDVDTSNTYDNIIFQAVNDKLSSTKAQKIAAVLRAANEAVNNQNQAMKTDYDNILSDLKELPTVNENAGVKKLASDSNNLANEFQSNPINPEGNYNQKIVNFLRNVANNATDNNKNHHINEPTTVSDIINFINSANNKVLDQVTTIKGNADDKFSLDSLSIQIPKGYRLTNPSEATDQIDYDGGVHNIYVTANSQPAPTPTPTPTPNPQPQPTPQPSNPTNTNTSKGTYVPQVASSSSANSSMASSSASASVAPASVNVNDLPPVIVNGKSENEKHAAKYAQVVKALQLHTNPNFTKRNGVAVVKPNTTFKIEKSVKAHNGALRYEVKYNKKNYFITANKHFVNAYYKAAKHHNYSVKNYVHYRYAKVIKSLWLHTNAKFTKRNGVKRVKPNTEFHISNIVKNHGLVRYEVRHNHKNYFITASHHYTVNAYVQKYNFRKHGYKGVRVIKPIDEYKKLSFTKRSLIRHFYRGSVLPVKKVVTIASGEMTRLQLTNGHYVTANKDFVEPIR